MNRKLQALLLVAGALLTPSGALATGSFNTNLLTNPGAETGDMTGWTIVDNGGNGWAAVGVLPHSGSHAFATSYSWCTRYQMIDLLAAGFTVEELDAAPTVIFEEWIRSRPEQGCEYFIRCELLDDAQQVIAEWHHGDQNDPIYMPYNTAYIRESHSFSSYGPGLRYVKIIDGGKDMAVWQGWYGAHFDDALVMLAAEVVCPADVNGDGVVDVLDLLELLSAWGPCP